MNRDTIKIIHKDIDEAIAKVGEKHGFKLTNGSNIRYDSAGFSFKAELSFTDIRTGCPDLL